MSFVNKFCWICLKKDNILKLTDKDKDGTTYVDKFASSLVGMNFKELNDMVCICEECCTILNTVYDFQQKCLRSKAYLISYISQVQPFSKISDSVNVKDSQKETQKKQNMQTIHGNIETVNQSTTFDSEDCVIVEDDILNIVAIKKEYESEENANNSQSIMVIEEDEIQNLYTSEDGYIQNYPQDFEHINMENTYIDIDEETENRISNKYGRLGNYEENIFDNSHESNGEIDVEEYQFVQIKLEPRLESESSSQDVTSSLITEAEMNNTCENSIDSRNRRTNYALKRKKPVLKRTCEICKKSFTKKCNLDVHMRVHSGDKPFECDICKKKFKQLTHLNVHMRVHSGEKPYACEMCERKFSTKWYLDIHKRDHTGERPYECEVCKKTFIHSGILNIHMRMHTGEKPYECQVCKKNFNIKGNFMVHMRIHEKERLYQCKLREINTKRSLNL